MRPYTKEDLAYDLKTWMYYAIIPGSTDPVSAHPAETSPVAHGEPTSFHLDHSCSNSRSDPDPPIPCPDQLTNLGFEFPEDPKPSIWAALEQLGIPTSDIPHLFIDEVSSGVRVLLHMGHVPLLVPRRKRKKRPPGDVDLNHHQQDQMQAHQRRCVPQRVIPVTLRPALLYYHHGHPLNGHKGVTRTRRALLQTVWWPYLTADVKRHIANCSCAKGYRELKQDRPKLVRSLLEESRAFNDHLNLDCSAAGPPSRRENAYFLVIVDTFSLYTRVIPLPVCTAMAVANAVVEEWFAVFGIC